MIRFALGAHPETTFPRLRVPAEQRAQLWELYKRWVSCDENITRIEPHFLLEDLGLAVRISSGVYLPTDLMMHCVGNSGINLHEALCQIPPEFGMQDAQRVVCTLWVHLGKFQGELSSYMGHFWVKLEEGLLYSFRTAAPRSELVRLCGLFGGPSLWTKEKVLDWLEKVAEQIRLRREAADKIAQDFDTVLSPSVWQHQKSGSTKYVLDLETLKKIKKIKKFL